MNTMFGKPISENATKNNTQHEIKSVENAASTLKFDAPIVPDYSVPDESYPQSQQQDLMYNDNYQMNNQSNNSYDNYQSSPEKEYANSAPTGDTDFDQVSLMIRKHEVGNPNRWGVFENIGDGAGITLGAYQFTEKSGKAQKLAHRLGFKSIYDQGFRKALSSPEGIAQQHRLFKETFYDPAKRIADLNGVRDPRAVAFLIDTNLNGGLKSVINRAKRKGGLTLQNLVAARNDRYRYLAHSNPRKYGKFLKGWIRRSNSFLG